MDRAAKSDVFEEKRGKGEQKNLDLHAKLERVVDAFSVQHNKLE